MVRKTGTAPKDKPAPKAAAKGKGPAKPASPKWGKKKTDKPAAADDYDNTPMPETQQAISTGEERVDPAQQSEGTAEDMYMSQDQLAPPASESNEPSAGPADDPAPETPAPKPAAKPVIFADGIGGNASAVLISSVERLERLMEERDAIGDDIKEVLGELKGVGFNTGIIRKVLSRRRMDPDKREEQDTLLETYEFALEKQK